MHVQKSEIASYTEPLTLPYGGVLQQLRPWAVKAPKLPAGLKTAAQEAGIETTPPETERVEAPSGATEDTPEKDTPANTSEIVSWNLAEARLERERLEGTDAARDRPTGTPK